MEEFEEFCQTFTDQSIGYSTPSRVFETYPQIPTTFKNYPSLINLFEIKSLKACILFYSSDISKLRRHIANSILSLVEYLNIDDIRQIYIERKFASREMFKDIERTYAGRTDQLIAVIITTLNSGANAMFTLLGILNGVEGSVGFFKTISDTSSEQSTNQHDVSRETSISNEDSAFGSRETSGKETDSLRASKSTPTKHSFLTRKGKETDSLRASKCPPTKQSFLISKDRKLQKGKEQMTSQKADNRASHLLESSCKKIKPKACSAPRKNDHMISRKTDSDSSYSMESISNPTKFKDRPLFKRKEHGIASNIKGSRIPVLTNVKENPKEDSTKQTKKTGYNQNSSNQDM